MKTFEIGERDLEIVATLEPHRLRYVLLKLSLKRKCSIFYAFELCLTLELRGKFVVPRTSRPVSSKANLYILASNLLSACCFSSIRSPRLDPDHIAGLPKPIQSLGSSESVILELGSGFAPIDQLLGPILLKVRQIWI